MDTQWEEIKHTLETKLDVIKNEISQYPGPITGCDAQFNYLLEQRYALAGELTRMKEAITSAELTDEFILTSPYLRG